MGKFKVKATAIIERDIAVPSSPPNASTSPSRPSDLRSKHLFESFFPPWVLHVTPR